MRPVARSYELAGQTWWGVTGRYATEKMSQDAFRLIQRKLRTGAVGLYRHGAPGEGPVMITAVAIDLDRDEIRRAARLLGAAVDEEVGRSNIQAMVIRHARFTVEADRVDMPAGWTRIRHAGRGARFDEFGHVHEPGRGQG